MFTAHCAGHGRRVLLFTEHIKEITNRPGGTEFSWRCTCGTSGSTFIGRKTEPIKEAA